MERTDLSISRQRAAKLGDAISVALTAFSSSHVLEEMDAAYGGVCFTDVSGVSRRNVLRIFVFTEEGRMVDPEKHFYSSPKHLGRC